MGIYYFLGGEDIKKRTSIEINKKAFKDAGRNPKVVVFPWTTEDEEKRMKYAGVIENYFKDLGANQVVFINPKEALETIAKEVDEANLVYIPGGLPEVFMNYAKSKNLKEILSKFNGVILGNSAGAMVLCNDVVITKDKDHPETKVIPGLDLVNFSVDVHYESSHDGELKELSIERKIFAIPENCAIKYVKEKDAFEYFGSIYLFEKGIKKKIN